MDVNEKVHITEYDESWAVKFASEKEVLLTCFTDAYIEHIGSTSVEGMAAKPIIDILLGISPYPEPKKITEVLNGLGYEDLSEAAKSSERMYFAKRGVYNYNIHVTKYSGKFWFHMISLRDYLRSHKDDALKYSELKKSILNRGIDSMLEYSKEKEDFLSDIIKKINSLNV